ncbi:conserved hypothetical protein [Parafrankia sp. EAN1pec]|uniref:DUF5947 family protein n=1 Tax=Parafrankia sp. (strain EAN1pec) TaxID=298653 RepID=UPI0000543346|nr:conserved hypothetical protein [Frankia sp. EAN1pec]
MTATLRRYLAPGTGPGAARCELCGERIAEEHGHITDLDTRSILCSCPGCRLLFTRAGAGGGRYRAVPTRYLFAAAFPTGAELLAAAGIPVGLAFFVIHDGAVGAFYPSPGGATHCELPASTTAGGFGADLAAAVGWQLTPEVEGLLVHTTRDGQSGYLLPIDACYRLVGELRLHWRGFDGGTQARQRLADFLADARRRAGSPDSDTDAPDSGTDSPDSRADSPDGRAGARDG